MSGSKQPMVACDGTNPGCDLTAKRGAGAGREPRFRGAGLAVAAAILGATLSSACSSNASGPGSALSQDQFHSAMPPRSDLPTGWQTENDTEVHDTADACSGDFDFPCPGQRLLASSSFVGPEGGTDRVIYVAAAYGSADDARQAFDQMDRESTTREASPSPPPQAGDQAFALSNVSGTVARTWIYVRVGAVVGSVEVDTETDASTKPSLPNDLAVKMAHHLAHR